MAVGPTWHHHALSDGDGASGGTVDVGEPWMSGAPRPPRPGIVPLRPLGAGELLDGAFQAMRRHPRLVLGAAALVAVVEEGLQLPVRLLFASSLGRLGATSGVVTPDQLGGLFREVAGGVSVLAVVGYVVGLLGGAVINGLLTVVVGRAVLGEAVDARDCWRAARRRVLGLIGLGLLTLVLELLVVAVCLVPLGLVLLLGGSALAAVLLGVLGGLAGVVAVVAVAVLLSLAPPAYVLEGDSMLGAVRRSAGLARARFWPVLGMLLLTGVITFFVAAAVSAPFSLGGSALTGAASVAGTATTLPGLVLSSLGTVIGLTVTLPFTAAVIGLLYVDARMRREGFDIELQRAAAARPVPR